MVKSAGNGNKPGTGIKPGTGMKPGTGLKPGTGMNPGTGIYVFGKSNSDSRNSKSMENCDCKKSCKKCCTGDRRLSMRLENLE